MKSGVDWSMKRGMRSPRYATHWDELPVVRPEPRVPDSIWETPSVHEL
ncbi:DUF4113 domain-containing protein [Burkholderia sp. LFS038]